MVNEIKVSATSVSRISWNIKRMSNIINKIRTLGYILKLNPHDYRNHR